MVSFSIFSWTTIIFGVITQQIALKGFCFAITETDYNYEYSEEADETYKVTTPNPYETGVYKIINSITSTLDQMNQRFGKLEQSSRAITSTLAQMNRRFDEVEQSSNSIVSTLAQLSQRLEKLEHQEASGWLTPNDIRALVSNPVAKLFSGANFSGESEDYNFLTSNIQGGCHNLKKLEGNVKSVDTMGKCVRLFNYNYCLGWSLAVYPGTPNSASVLNSKIKKVGSIGPCLEGEFQLAYFTGTGRNGDVRKNSTNIRAYVPDLLEFMSYEKYNSSRRAPYSKFSLENYKLGLNGRLEFVRAEIRVKHLNISQPKIKSENLKRLVIPVWIGGPGNKAYNLVPQSPSARGELEALAVKVRVFLGKNPGGEVYFYLNFMYESENDKAPYAFYYLIDYHFGTSGSGIEYGRIVN